MTTLDRYLASNIVAGILVAAAILLPLFAFLDLLDQLDDVGEAYYTLAGAFQYVLLLVPRRFLQLLPFIALLGNVIALGRMAVNLELTAMRATGRSVTRIAAVPLLLAVLLIAVAAMLEEYVAPDYEQRALTRRSQALSESVELGAGLGIWTRDASRVLRLGDVQQASRPRDVEIFELGPDGRLARYIRADAAEVEGSRRWLLLNARVDQVGKGRMQETTAASLAWRPFVDNDQIESLTRPPGSLSVTQLHALVKYLRQGGQESDAYALALWRKPGSALTMIAMVLLAIPFALGSLRSGIGHRLFLAGVAGIGIYLLDQIVANTGLLLDLRPELVALTPGVVLVIASMLLLRRLA